jgi:UDP:flavonoid glycosyltransferase YjiC (YdhE family)
VLPRERCALIDPLPAMRSMAGEHAPSDSIATRTLVHRGDRAEGAQPRLAVGAALVLAISAGTTVRQPGLLAGLVASVVDAGYEVAVTMDPGTLPVDLPVHQVGFVPLASLLPAVSAVVGTAGLGTVLATLAAGLPAVPRPVLADQQWNARLVVSGGAGITIEDPAAAGPAIRTVLPERAYRAAARAAADSIRSMPSPADGIGELLARTGASSGV